MENSIVQKRWAKATPKDKRNQGNVMRKVQKKFWSSLTPEQRKLRMKCVRMGLSWKQCQKKFKEEL